MRAQLLFMFIAVLVTGCSSQPELPPANFDEPLPAVAAQYQTVHHCEHNGSHNHAGHTEQVPDDTDKIIDWRFFRSAQRLTIDNLSAQTGEDWQRDGKAIFMRKLFYADHKAIEYRSDDLTVLNIDPQWTYKALLIDPDELKLLGVPKGYWENSVPLYRYQGDINGEALLIVWRGDLGIPVRIERKAGDCEEVTELQQASVLEKSPWPTPAIDDYLVIDYSDIGDMERDPFIQKVYSQLPGGDVHHH